MYQIIGIIFWCNFQLHMFQPGRHYRIQHFTRGASLESCHPLTLPCGVRLAIKGTFPPIVLKSSASSGTPALHHRWTRSRYLWVWCLTCHCEGVWSAHSLLSQGQEMENTVGGSTQCHDNCDGILKCL